MKKKISDESKLVWLAAIIDGEGTIGITKQKERHYYIRLNVNNTSEALIDYLQENYGGNKGGPYKEKVINHKDRFVWTCENREAIELIEKIELYLIIKQEQAELAIKAYKDTFKNRYNGRKTPKYACDKREQYYQQMKKLNQRGKEVDDCEEKSSLKLRCTITLEEFGV